MKKVITLIVMLLALRNVYSQSRSNAIVLHKSQYFIDLRSSASDPNSDLIYLKISDPDSLTPYRKDTIYSIVSKKPLMTINIYAFYGGIPKIVSISFILKPEGKQAINYDFYSLVFKDDDFIVIPKKLNLLTMPTFYKNN